MSEDDMASKIKEHMKNLDSADIIFGMAALRDAEKLGGIKNTIR